MGKPHKYSLADHSPHDVLGFGILTDEADYRLCWLINQSLGLALTRVADLSVSTKHSPLPQSFTCFELKESAGKTLCRLVSNRSKEGFHLTEHRTLDYIILFHVTDDPAVLSGDLKRALAGIIPQIRGLFELEPKALTGLF